MSYIQNKNHFDQIPHRNKPLRNNQKNRLNDLFKQDLLLQNINPFSEELTPWNGSARLQISVNLLKKQVEKTSPVKIRIPSPQVSVQHIVSHDSLQLPNLSIQQKLHDQDSHHSSRHFCPKLKINSQQVIVSKSQRSPVKRFLFKKKSTHQQKLTKKIANLTMQWDEDIVYNPEKKHFEEQNLKRKFLKQFPYSRNENRQMQNLKKQLVNEGKSFKLEFKNNKIHKKQISIFQFKKKVVPEQQEKNKYEDEKQKQLTEFLSINRTNKSSQDQVVKKQQGLLNNFQSKYRTISPDHDRRNLSTSQFRSDKWKFRTSLKTRRSSGQKNTNINGNRGEYNDKILSQRGSVDIKNQKDILNKITLQLHKQYKEVTNFPFQIFTKTSPQFFKKTID